MKLVLISDSHGNKNGINRIFERVDFDKLIFLGDGLNDLGSSIYLDNVFAVSGNCDFFSSYPNERIIELEGKKILITHGNKYGVKSGLNMLVDYAVGQGVDMVFFGHTHKQLAEERRGVLVINPGSFKCDSNGLSNGIIVNIDNNDLSIQTFAI